MRTFYLFDVKENILKNYRNNYEELYGLLESIHSMAGLHTEQSSESETSKEKVRSCLLQLPKTLMFLKLAFFTFIP